MKRETENNRVDKTQRAYARLAGVLLLGAIGIAIGSGTALSHIAGDGTFAQTAARIGASQRLYRGALLSLVILTLSSNLLAFALYATLKPFDRLLAQIGLIFSLADSFMALVVRMCGFVRLHLYLGLAGPGSTLAEPLSNLMRTIAGVSENIGGISFGVGSCLFFYLFFQSIYIPKVISALGVVASAIWAILYCANLVFPEHHALFLDICFPPLAVAEVTTGLYLIVFAVKVERSNSERAQYSELDAR